MPAEAPSRAYAKIEEAIAWAQLPVRAGDVALEIGAAPGGAVMALARRGVAAAPVLAPEGFAEGFASAASGGDGAASSLTAGAVTVGAARTGVSLGPAEDCAGVVASVVGASGGAAAGAAARQAANRPAANARRKRTGLMIGLRRLSSGPLIPTFAKVLAAMGCECWNWTTGP